MRAALSLAIGSVLLVACGGDKTQSQTEKQSVDYSQLKITPQDTAKLQTVGGSKLAQHLKNGIRLQLTGGYYQTDASGGRPVVSAPTAGGALESGARGNFSETNVHVEGVDEADYAKYDGTHWFVATYPRYAFDAPAQSPGFQIVATDPAKPGAEIVGAYEFDKEWGDVASLYLVQEDDNTSHVAAIRNQWGNVYPALPGFPIDMIAIDIARPAVGAAALIARPGPQNSKVRVQLVDVSAPATPEQDWEIELDGSLIDSRKIGNTLYLITRFDPWLNNLRFEQGDSTIRDQNEKILEDARTEQLLPHYRIGSAEFPLGTDCLVQEGIKDNYGLGSLVNITAIDLADQEVVGNTCLNSRVEVMSMSTDALYLTGTVYDGNARGQNTVIHKFSLAESGPKYEATGSVSGSVGWNSDPAFRMHAHEGDFRIVTSTWTNGGPEHQLTILRQRTNVLVTQGNLPNSADPAPIGKPGEDIFAVRFVGTRAYIVTFQRTDPLYAIDLTNPGQPRILGELEIPGFATYMHPVGDKLLFTLGNSADERGVVTGIKADLFDVSGDAPKVVDSIELGDVNSQSEALRNLRAISLVQASDDQLRIALPITRYQGQRTPTTGLQLLEVNGISSGRSALADAGTVVAANGDVYYGAGVSRGIIHDDAVFFSHNNMIWAASWDNPKNPIGPITKDPIACTTEARPSLQVTVFGDRADPSVDFCDATVTAAWGNERYVLDAQPATDLIAPADGRPCVFVGPYEVGGTLDVHIDMPGYLPLSLESIFVPRGICHVQTQELRAMLKPR